MATLLVTDRDESTRSIEASDGLSIMEALRDNGFDIAATCGGMCACATCHIYIDDNSECMVGERTAAETDLLELVEYFQPNSRLACQIMVSDEMDGLSLKIAPEE